MPHSRETVMTRVSFKQADVVHGLRGGFFDDEAPAPPPPALTAAEVERREELIEKAIGALRRKAAPKKPGKVA